MNSDKSTETPPKRILKYLRILRVLARHGPLKFTHIIYKANINAKQLQIDLDYLIERNLIAQRKFGRKRIGYAITQKGRQVFESYRIVESVFFPKD